MGFSTTLRTPPKIPIKFSGLILFSFHRENDSIINDFHTMALPFTLKIYHKAKEE
jgi:hypothetical protein